MTRDTGAFRTCAIAWALVALTWSMAAAQQAGRYRTFASPNDAVQALIAAVKSGSLDEVLAIFGPDGDQLVASSDPATGRRNREVFTIAVGEKWQLADDTANRKTLVIGNE